MALDDSIDLRLVNVARAALDQGDTHSAMKALDELIATKPQLQQRTLQQRCEDGRNALRQDYFDDVNSAAEDVVSDWKNGNFDGMRDAVTDAIDQACDGHSRCTNAGDIFETLLFSPNEEAYKEHSDEAEFSTMAYYAFKQDVYDAVAAEVDLSKRPPNEGDKLCSACDEYEPGDAFNGEECANCSESNGNARCDDCEKWFTEAEITDGQCTGCKPKEAASG